MRLLAVSCLASVAAVAPAGALAQTGPRLAFAQDAGLTISVEGDAKSASATVVLVNNGPGIDRLQFSAVSEKANAANVKVQPAAGSTVPANAAVSIKLSFTSDDSLAGFDGHLVVATEDAVAERDLKIDAKNELPFSVNFIIIGSAAIAVALSAIRALTLRHRLGYLLSAPSWDFSKSWASTFTVVGAVLGTILSSLVLPDTPVRFSKATLAGMNLVFGVAILLAPLVFALTQTGRRVKKDSSPEETQPQGPVAGYLAASAVTLTGVIGQLVTVFFLLDEIGAKGALPGLALFFMAGLLAIAGVIVLVHAWKTMGWTAANGTEPPKRRPPPAPAPAAAFTPSLL